MADKGQQSQNMIQQPSSGISTVEELLGALGMLGGSYLKARSLTGHSWLGDPLSLAGQGLLGLGSQGAENRTKAEREKAVADLIKNAQATGGVGPAMPKGQFLGSMLGIPNEEPKEALDITEAIYPKETKENFDYWINPTTGDEKVLPRGSGQPGPGYFTRSVTSGEGKPKTLSGEESILASHLGLNEDPAKWTPSEAGKFLNANTELKKARAATPLAVVMPAIGTGPDGAPVPGMAVAPRVGRSGIGAPTFTPFSGGTTPSALVGKVDKPPTGADTTNYSYGKSDKFPGLLIGRPKPVKGLIAKAGEYALPTPTIAYYKGRQLKVGDTFTYYPPKGKPVKVILEAKDLE